MNEDIIKVCNALLNECSFFDNDTWVCMHCGRECDGFCNGAKIEHKEDCPTIIAEKLLSELNL